MLPHPWLWRLCSWLWLWHGWPWLQHCLLLQHGWWGHWSQDHRDLLYHGRYLWYPILLCWSAMIHPILGVRVGDHPSGKAEPSSTPYC